MKTRFEIYKDIGGEFRWHATRSGRIVAESGESYVRRAACRKSLINFTNSIVLGHYTLIAIDK